MSLALQEPACAKTVQEEDYDVAAAFAEFGERAPNAWEPIHAAQIYGFAAAPANQHGRPFPALKRRPPRLDARLLMRGLAGADWLAVLAAADIAARWGNGLGLAGLSLAHAVIFLSAALSLKAGLWITGVYRETPNKISLESASGGLTLGAMAALAVAAIAAPDARAAAALAATIPVAAISMAAFHAVFALCMRSAWRVGAFAETAVVVGATDAAARFIARAAADGSVRVAAIADDRTSRTPETLAGAPVAGGVDEMLAWHDLPKIDRIVICVSHAADARVRTLIEKLRAVPNRVDLLFDFEIEAARGRRLERLGGVPIATVCGRSTDPARALAKRLMDVILGGALLIAAIPVMLVIAALVRLDSPGPVFFRQRRHGLNNKVISIWKFRTMHADADAGAMRQVCADDPRVTRIGKVLRRMSLDELPQLVNVLAGSMSLVGPRPHAIDMRAQERELTDIVAEYAHRHRVKPGITGWAQVNGSRGPVETPEAVKRRVALDLDYIAKASLWLDLWILARTIPALLGDRKNVR